jgi:uncharacterized protein YeaO (DUF488 family)
MTPDIRVRRVYEEPGPSDGARVLVDRIWPRGLRRDAAQLDEWAKEAAPSGELRTWYGHDPAKFGEFRARYLEELSSGAPRAALGRLRALAAAGPVTLLTATRDAGRSNAAVLAQVLQGADGGAGGEPAGGEPAGGESACFAHLVCPDCGSIVSEGHAPGCTSASRDR